MRQNRRRRVLALELLCEANGMFVSVRPVAGSSIERPIGSTSVSPWSVLGRLRNALHRADEFRSPRDDDSRAEDSPTVQQKETTE
jgi:hypothetical protein